MYLCTCVFVSFLESKREDEKENWELFTSIDCFLAVKHVDRFPDGIWNRPVSLSGQQLTPLSFCNVPYILSFSFTRHGGSFGVSAGTSMIFLATVIKCLWGHIKMLIYQYKTAVVLQLQVSSDFNNLIINNNYLNVKKSKWGYDQIDQYDINIVHLYPYCLTCSD